MEKVIMAVEKHKQLILKIERHIWENPETGFKEYKTTAYMEKIFKQLGYEPALGDGITGFYTVLDTKRPGPQILVLAELDSVICADHKDADEKTGAVHACGHNAQCAALAGIAAALKEPGIIDDLCGKIRLCVVPAEELLEIEYRQKLKDEGKIKYLDGKSEFLSRGYFDGADMAILVHAAKEYTVIKGNVGCVVKRIIYKGEAAHAGGAPWKGKNALYAANCGINAINALRETFKEEDVVRVHPIITNGGAMVNAIPDHVTMECYVRGASFDAIYAINKSVNRALIGAAVSLGTNVEIIDTPGYSPLVNNLGMIDVAKEAADIVIPHHEFSYTEAISAGSTDMGALSCIMPVIQPYAKGASGKEHGSDYEIKDPVSACVDSAKLQLAMLKILLTDNAKRAKKIIEEYKPIFSSKEKYFDFLDGINYNGNRIRYTENGEIIIL